MILLHFLSKKIKKLIFFSFVNSINCAATMADARAETVAEARKIFENIPYFKDNPKSPHEFEENIEKLFDANLEGIELNNEVKKLVKEVLKKKNSIIHMIVVEMILKTAIAAVITKVVEFLFYSMSEKFSPILTILKEEERTIKMLELELGSTAKIKPDAFVKQSMSKLVLSEEVSSKFYNILAELKAVRNNPKHCCALRPLMVFEGSSGTGKTSLTSILQKVLLLSSPQKENMWNKILDKLPIFIKAIFNIYKNKNVLVITISGSYFFNQSDFDKAANSFENILTKILEDRVSNKPNTICLIVVEEGETICNIPQFVSVLKSWSSQLERMMKEKVNGKRKHGVVICCITTNHAADFDVYLMRRIYHIPFPQPTESMREYSLRKYLEKIGVENCTKALFQNLPYIVRYCPGSSQSDMENIVSILSYDKLIKGYKITIFSLLKCVEASMVKKDVIVLKNNSEGLSNSREVLNIKAITNKWKKMEMSLIGRLIDSSEINPEPIELLYFDNADVSAAA